MIRNRPLQHAINRLACTVALMLVLVPTLVRGQGSAQRIAGAGNVADPACASVDAAGTPVTFSASVSHDGRSCARLAAALALAPAILPRVPDAGTAPAPASPTGAFLPAAAGCRGPPTPTAPRI